MGLLKTVLWVLASGFVSGRPRFEPNYGFANYEINY